MRREVLVVIPAYNEAQYIEGVVVQVKEQAYEVLVVSDGSTDSTSSRALNAGAYVHRRINNGGYGAAVKDGLAFAIEHGFDTVVTLDGDGAHDPQEISRLLGQFTRSELLIGDRFGGRSPDRWLPSTKKWANYFAANLVNIFLETSLNDVACGYRVLTNQLASQIVEDNRYARFGMAYGMIQLAQASGYTIRNWPVSIRYDACEVQLTRQQEILDLLKSVRQFTDNESHAKQLVSDLEQIIRMMEPATIVVGEVTLCIHPIRERQAYAFQAQNPYFSVSVSTSGEVFEFSEVSSASGGSLSS